MILPVNCQIASGTFLLGISLLRQTINRTLVMQMSASVLPMVPKPSYTSDKTHWDPKEVARIRHSLSLSSTQFDAARPISKKLSRTALTTVELLQQGKVQESESLGLNMLPMLKELVSNGLLREDSRYHISQGIEDFITAKAFRYFLSTGKVLALNDIIAECENFPFTSSEYIGSCCSLIRELATYSLERASSLDLKSVNHVHNCVIALSSQLQQFDYRNNALRRKYDTIKYNVRRLEDLRFQLSMIGEHSSEELENTTSFDDKLNPDDFRLIREDMEHVSEVREKVIKHSRDIQRFSKNSISALLRGDRKAGVDLLANALNRANEILPDVQKYPELRSGSFSSSMEEYVEGVVLADWLESGVIPSCSSITIVNDVEYMGGVLDFTGEVNRYGIAQATKRDLAALSRCLEVVCEIKTEVLMMGLDDGLHGSGLGRKLSTLDRTLRKLQDVHLELCLRQASGWVLTPNIGTDEIPQDL